MIFAIRDILVDNCCSVNFQYRPSLNSNFKLNFKVTMVLKKIFSLEG